MAPTESEILVRDFLAANPSLDAELDEVKVVEDSRTNEEWASQIKETQAQVLKEIESDEREKKKYEAPKQGSKDFAQTVDHTVLKLDANESQIDALCAEARTEEFKSVCVRLNWVSRCVSNLKGSTPIVACVVGFHEGTQDTISKLREARAAVQAGALELDLVLNYSLLTNAGDATPDYSAIYRELASIRALCPHPVVIKLILETSQLSSTQILAAAHLAASANLDFIKTSTGFNGPGASLPNVQLMVAAAEYLAGQGKNRMQVKASGGVRSLADAVKMLEAGATRLGTSSGLVIMKESKGKSTDGAGSAEGY